MPKVSTINLPNHVAFHTSLDSVTGKRTRPHQICLRMMIAQIFFFFLKELITI